MEDWQDLQQKISQGQAAGTEAALREREKRLLLQLQRQQGMELAVRSSVLAAIDRLDLKDSLVTPGAIVQELTGYGREVEAAQMEESRKYLERCLEVCAARGLVMPDGTLTRKGRQIGREYNQRLYSC